MAKHSIFEVSKQIVTAEMLRTLPHLTLRSAPRAQMLSTSLRCLSTTAPSAVSLAVDNDGIATISMSLPPVNPLGRDMLKGLRSVFEQVRDDPSIKAAVLHGEGGVFMAGADIEELQRLQSAPRAEMANFIDDGSEVLNNLIEASQKPVIAAIDGAALGGGLELALACHHRLCTPKSTLGLPELQLGLIPGLGGTQRLPRVAGMRVGLEVMLQGRTLKGADALKAGVVGSVVPEGSDVVAAAKGVALRMANGGDRPVRTLLDLAVPDSASEVATLLAFAEKTALRRAPVNSPHIQACLTALKAAKAQAQDPMKGLAAERQAFLDVAQGDGAKALVHFFFAQRAVDKLKGITDIGLKPEPIDNLAVCGGGLMGSGIVTASLLKGMNVILREVDEKALAPAEKRIRRNMESRVKKGRMTEAQLEDCMSRLSLQTDFAGFENVQLVIEAIVENKAIKQELFKQLEQVTSPTCLLTTNTSTINITDVTRHIADRSRIAGAHFFSPAHVMPLLELVKSDDSSPQTIVSLLGYARRLRKTPVVAGNCEGFVVNRSFFPYGQSADLLVDRGVSPYRIDKVVSAFGMPMGPFRLTDLVGGDVYLFVNATFHEAYRERTYRSPLRQILADAGRIGEKAGKGFYVIDADSRKALEDPELQGLLEQSRSEAGLPAIDGQLSDADIIERIFFPVVNEACRVLSEGMANKASDVDVASVFGMGFPVTRGGLMCWADTVGAKHIYERLSEWYEQDGVFYKPCQFLKDRAEAGKTLSEE